MYVFDYTCIIRQIRQCLENYDIILQNQCALKRFSSCVCYHIGRNSRERQVDPDPSYRRKGTRDIEERYLWKKTYVYKFIYIYIYI